MDNITIYSKSVFDQPWWLDAVAEGQWHEAIVEDYGNVAGRLPYVMCKNRFSCSIKMPKLTQNFGIWISETEKIAGNGWLARQKDIMGKLMDQLPRKAHIRICLSPENKYVLPIYWHGFSIKTKFTYRIENIDCEAIYNNFHNTVIKNIKSASKKVIIRQDLNIDILFNLLNLTFAAQNRKNPISKELIKRITTACEAHGAGKLFAAEDANGNIHACAYFVYDKKVCYYLLAGSDPRFRSSGAQSLILWEGIKFAARHSKVFDFEGSMIEGIENFIRQFGGECVPYYEIRRLPILLEIMDLLKPRIKKFLKYK